MRIVSRNNEKYFLFIIFFTGGSTHLIFLWFFIYREHRESGFVRSFMD